MNRRTCPLCDGTGVLVAKPAAEEPTLFDVTRAEIAMPADGQVHRDAHDTERTAALAVAPRTGTLRAKVLDALTLSDEGLTDHQLARALDKYLYSVAPRRTELLHGGWLEDSGQRRLTPNGSPAIVWRLSPVGRARLARES